MLRSPEISQKKAVVCLVHLQQPYMFRCVPITAINLKIC